MTYVLSGHSIQVKPCEEILPLVMMYTSKPAKTNVSLHFSGFLALTHLVPPSLFIVMFVKHCWLGFFLHHVVTTNLSLLSQSTTVKDMRDMRYLFHVGHEVLTGVGHDVTRINNCKCLEDGRTQLNITHTFCGKLHFGPPKTCFLWASQKRESPFGY